MSVRLLLEQVFKHTQHPCQQMHPHISKASTHQLRKSSMKKNNETRMRMHTFIDWFQKVAWDYSDFSILIPSLIPKHKLQNKTIIIKISRIENI